MIMWWGITLKRQNVDYLNVSCSPTLVKYEWSEEFIRVVTHKLNVLRLWVKMWRQILYVSCFLDPWSHALGSHCLPNKWYQIIWLAQSW